MDSEPSPRKCTICKANMVFIRETKYCYIFRCPNHEGIVENYVPKETKDFNYHK